MVGGDAVGGQGGVGMACLGRDFGEWYINAISNSKTHARQSRLDNLFSLTSAPPVWARKRPIAGTGACKVAVKVPGCWRLIHSGELVVTKCCMDV